MKLPQDLKEFIELLNAVEVKYVVVGGYAVAVHGYPRFTGDIDVLIEPTSENALRVVNVLNRLGFVGLGFHAGDFSRPDVVVQLGVPPNRIDLMTSLTGVTFAEAWTTRIQVQLDGIPLMLIGKEMLIRNKRATGRLKDLADVEAIEDTETSSGRPSA